MQALEGWVVFQVSLGIWIILKTLYVEFFKKSKKDIALCLKAPYKPAHR